MEPRRRGSGLTLGDKVKEQRMKKNMNQKQLAERSNITQATISRIEAGKVNQLKSNALRRLAEALGVPINYLVDQAKKLTPDDLVSSDPDAAYIFRGYEKLDHIGREQLKKFVQFLEDQEKGK